MQHNRCRDKDFPTTKVSWVLIIHSANVSTERTSLPSKHQDCLPPSGCFHPSLLLLCCCSLTTCCFHALISPICANFDTVLELFILIVTWKNLRYYAENLHVFQGKCCKTLHINKNYCGRKAYPRQIIHATNFWRSPTATHPSYSCLSPNFFCYLLFLPSLLIL